MNEQCSLPPSIATTEEGTEPPVAPWVPQQNWLPTAPGVCSLLTAVCEHLDALGKKVLLRN